jgi:hypothetical protein
MPTPAAGGSRLPAGEVERHDDGDDHEHRADAGRDRPQREPRSRRALAADERK